MCRTSRAAAALTSLVVQNTSLVILLKLSFRGDARPYDPSTVVLIVEFVKLVASSCVVCRKSAIDLFAVVVQIPRQWMLFVPSLLYVLQNNLLFFGAKRLSPIVYIVCTQMKILTSAVWARLLLGTELSALQHVALISLVFGVVLVQGDKSAGNGPTSDSTLQESYGVVSVLLASLTSGLAGVVLEQIFKVGQDLSNYEHTLWSRNVQLSLVSIPFALAGTLITNPGHGPVFAGFDVAVLSVILLQAIGGIITGYVLKFSNNISKCIAVSISICCCAVYSVATKELSPTPELFFGVIVVNAAVGMYSMGARPALADKGRLGYAKGIITLREQV